MPDRPALQARLTEARRRGIFVIAAFSGGPQPSDNREDQGCHGKKSSGQVCYMTEEEV